jgi:hypothetical protein
MPETRFLHIGSYVRSALLSRPPSPNSSASPDFTSIRLSTALSQEFPQNFGALVANPFELSVLLFTRSGIAQYGSIGPETSVT